MADPTTKISEVMEKAAATGRQRKSYYSFGDEKGLTATVSASGSLLRITQHFPGERHGFCIDHPEMPEPYLVQKRLEKLLSWSKSTPATSGVIGPSIDSFCSDYFTDDMINDRWPIFYRTCNSGVNLTVKYVASEGTLYQIFQTSSGPKTEMLPLEITPDLLIRNLDFIDEANSFNEAGVCNEKVYSYEIRGNSLIREHENGDKKAVLCIQALDEETSFGKPSLEFVQPARDQPAQDKQLVQDQCSAQNEEPIQGQQPAPNQEPAHDQQPAQNEESTQDQQPVNQKPTQDQQIVQHHQPTQDQQSARHDRNVHGLLASSESKHGASGSVYSIRRKSTAPKSQTQDDPGHRFQVIILVYRVDYVPKNESPEITPALWSNVSDTTNRLLTPRSRPPLANTPAMDFFLGRNLEHIMSVCSVPVPKAADDKEPPIALTCGDVDGHRVTTAASFYAFQTLLLALEHFRSLHSLQPLTALNCECHLESPAPYICVMSKRIERICYGHIKWLLHKVAMPGEPFCPHYWVDGKKIKGWKKNKYLPGRCLVDTPFQLIKAGDFQRCFGDHMLDKEVIRDVVDSWIEELEKVDQRGVYAFPRYDKASTRSFYLTDHVLIWQAVKSAEVLGASPRTSKDYSSGCLQKNIIKRFTTRNPVSGERMISVGRSAFQTRFLLRSKDSALFRAMELGLFDTSTTEKGRPDQKRSDIWHNKIGVWKSTIECQRYHESNDDMLWEDPQRFALSIIMVRYLQKSINLRSKQEMLEQALSVLFSSSSANGLFPGKLDKLHEPVLYDNELLRDTYWGNTFEVPYLLWKYCSDMSDKSTFDQKPEYGPLNRISKDESPIDLYLGNQISNIEREIRDQELGLKGSELLLQCSMKDAFAFNNSVNVKNIVELQDEWLYNMPSFFVPAKSQKDDTQEKFIGDAGSQVVQDQSEASSIIDQDSKGFTGAKLDLLKLNSLKSVKNKEFSELVDKEFFSTEAEIEKIIARGRAPDHAKKRIWFFKSLEPSENMPCLLTVSEKEVQEQKAVEHFLDEHKSYNISFWEETSTVFNTWETQLHLSFYSICSDGIEKEKKGSSTGEGNSIIFPGLTEGGKITSVRKAIASFRFEGDFFDRYWTCRVLLADPSKDWTYEGPTGDSQSENNSETGSDDRRTENTSRKSISHVSDDEIETSEEEDDETPIIEEYEVKLLMHRRAVRQRRVLELVLFDVMISDMNSSADGILKTTKELLEKGKDNMRRSFDATKGNLHPTGNDEVERLDYNGFLIASQRFQEFQNGLRKFEGNLAQNLGIIDVWLQRAKTREAERPRWTFNDESRHRVDILKWVARNDRQIRDLRGYHKKVLNLIESTAKDLEHMRTWLDILRNDLDLRRSEDIKRFTYVTVVFLPLGFATGIFSTSGSPAGKTLVSMILTAISTLTITLLGLVGYKFIDSPRARKELSDRWVGFKARLLRFVILATILVLMARLKDSSSKESNQQKHENIREKSERDAQGVEGGTAKRQRDSTAERQQDNTVDEQRNSTTERQRGSTMAEQSRSTEEEERSSADEDEVEDPTTNEVKRTAEKWSWGAIMRSLRKTGTDNLQKAFQEDVENRGASDVGTAAEVERGSIASQGRVNPE